MVVGTGEQPQGDQGGHLAQQVGREAGPLLEDGVEDGQQPVQREELGPQLLV